MGTLGPIAKQVGAEMLLEAHFPFIQYVMTFRSMDACWYGYLQQVTFLRVELSTEIQNLALTFAKLIDDGALLTTIFVK